jgi:hypothetical protein
VRATSLVLSLSAFAALAGGAGAQTPPDVLSGGALGPHDEGYASPHDAFVTVGGKQGDQLPVTATSALACGGHTRQIRLNAVAARDATGAFTVARAYTSDGGRLRARVTLTGRTLGDEAVGALTATGTLREPGRRAAIECAKTTVDWRAHRVGTAAAATGAVARDALLVGVTTGADKHAPVSPILLRTSADGRSLPRAKWRVAVACDRTADDDLAFAFRPIRLSATGRFVADVHAVDPHDDTTWDLSVRFGGHVGADGAAGYLRVVERADRGGRIVNRCDTGRLRWSALVTPPAAPAAR